MNKQHILVEIARTAVANGGNPLGKERFFKETGIKESDWAGKYWARWSDAVTEAGCAPNRLQQPLDEEGLLQALAETVRELGHWPVITELKLRARQVPGFPSHNTFRRFGSKDDQISKLITYCEAGPAWRDVADTLRASHRSEAAPIQNESALPTEIGYVYLLKANRYFKIGRSSLFHAYPVNAQKLGAATTGSVWRRVKLPPIVSLGVNRIGMVCSSVDRDSSPSNYLKRQKQFTSFELTIQ